MSGSDTGIPDLLRRFAPTAYHVTGVAHQVGIELHTNDIEIVTKVRPEIPRATRADSFAPLQAKIIRDYDAPPDGSHVTIISAPPLVSLFVGRGTVLTLDCARRELVGFLASSVTAERLFDELLPIILARLNKAPSPNLDERGSESE